MFPFNWNRSVCIRASNEKKNPSNAVCTRLGKIKKRNNNCESATNISNFDLLSRKEPGGPRWIDSRPGGKFEFLLSTWFHPRQTFGFIFVSLSCSEQRRNFFCFISSRIFEERIWGRKILSHFFFMKIQRKLVSVTVVGKDKQTKKIQNFLDEEYFSKFLLYKKGKESGVFRCFGFKKRKNFDLCLN